MSETSVSIVVPVYRDGGSLNELSTRLREALSQSHPNYELILVDDGSPDDSWKTIEALAAADKRVKGIRLSRNFGQHPAIAAGFDSARGDVVVLMDADLEDRPEDITTLLERLGPNVDIVYTIKRGERGGILNQVTSVAFHRVFASIVGTQVPMHMGTLRAFKRKVLTAIQAHREYNVLFGPLMVSIGFPSEFVTVHRDTRDARASTYTFRRRLSLAAKTLASYTNIPHRIFLTTGAIALGTSMLYSLAILVDYLFVGRRLPPGITLVALSVLVSLGLTMLGLGVIGLYVFRVYQEVLGRPRYLISEQLNRASADSPALQIRKQLT
jgi:polyisoprenyl-phosphate glycosyltransferase